MRFRYLRIALLAGLLAATAPADSTRTNSKVATSREARSRPSDREDIAAIDTSVGDENRSMGPFRASELTVKRFFKEILLHRYDSRSSIMDGLTKTFNTMVEETTPQEAYRSIVSFKTRPKLDSIMWRRWAFLASKYCAYHELNPHEFIVEAMSNLHGIWQFSEMLAAAADKRSMAKFVKKLQEVQISLWFRKNYSLEQVFNLLRLSAKWKENIFASPQFATWIRYLKRVRKTVYEDDPVGTEVRSLREFIDFGALLKMPLLPQNASDPKSTQYLHVLKGIGLDEISFPYQFVSMLLQDAKDDEEKFTLLFMDGPTREFWRSYNKEFNEQYPLLTASLCKTLLSIFSLEELFTMLRAAVNAPDVDRRQMALSYINDQFVEWRTAGATFISDIMPDRTNIPSRLPPVITATWKAYIKFLVRNVRPSRADFNYI